MRLGEQEAIVEGAKKPTHDTRRRQDALIPMTGLCNLIHNQGVVVERNSGKLIRMLEENGWVHVATKGSHRQFTHPTKRGRVTVSHPNKDIPRGTTASIYRQAGWKT